MKYIDATEDISEAVNDAIEHRSIFTDFSDDPDDLLNKFDSLLKRYGLEIVDYDLGSDCWCIGIEPIKAEVTQ